MTNQAKYYRITQSYRISFGRRPPRAFEECIKRCEYWSDTSRYKLAGAPPHGEILRRLFKDFKLNLDALNDQPD